jgi:hypothetical protein
MPPAQKRSQIHDDAEAHRLGIIGISGLFTLSVVCLSLGFLLP